MVQLVPEDGRREESASVVSAVGRHAQESRVGAGRVLPICFDGGLSRGHVHPATDPHESGRQSQVQLVVQTQGCSGQCQSKVLHLGTIELLESKLC